MRDRIRIYSDLLAAVDAGNISLDAMLDLSAAFDCVDQEILLKRLSSNFCLDPPITQRLIRVLHPPAAAVGGSS